MINSADCVRLKMLLSTVRNREARKSSLDKKLCRKGWQLASKVHHFYSQGHSPFPLCKSCRNRKFHSLKSMEGGGGLRP